MTKSAVSCEEFNETKDVDNHRRSSRILNFGFPNKLKKIWREVLTITLKIILKHRNLTTSLIDLKPD